MVAPGAGLLVAEGQPLRITLPLHGQGRPAACGSLSAVHAGRIDPEHLHQSAQNRQLLHGGREGRRGVHPSGKQAQHQCQAQGRPDGPPPHPRPPGHRVPPTLQAGANGGIQPLRQVSFGCLYHICVVLSFN